MNLSRLTIIPFLFLSYGVQGLPYHMSEGDLVADARVIDVSDEEWAGQEVTAQTLALESNEATDQKLQLDIAFESDAGRRVKHLASASGESVLVDTSVLEGGVMTGVKTVWIKNGTNTVKRMRVTFIDQQEAKEMSLVITSDKEILPMVVLTEDANLMGKHWDSNPFLDLRELLPEKMTGTAATTQPDEEGGSLLGLYITVGCIIHVGGQLMWAFGNLNYSVNHDNKPLTEFALILQGFSYIAGFPLTPIQEVLGQVLYYYRTGKPAGLELLHVLSKETGY